MTNDDFERQKWQDDRATRHAERAHDLNDEAWASRTKSAIEAANIAMRSAILVNGGAAISLLAFIGSLAAQGRVANEEIRAVANSLLWFAGGVAAALITVLGAYFVNFLQAEAMAAKRRIWAHPFVEHTPRSRRIEIASQTIHILAIVMGLVSVGCFVAGIFDVRGSIAKIGLTRSMSVQVD